MSLDLMFHCIFFLIFTIFLVHTTAYATGASNFVNKLTDPEDLSTIGKISFLEPWPRGKLVLKPNNLKEFDERTVYDPGDELFHVLNADVAAATNQNLKIVSQSNDYDDTAGNDLDMEDKNEIFQKLHQDLRDEQDMVTKSNILMKMLEDPNLDTLPLIYIEDEDEDTDVNASNNIINSNGLIKRSRYYRRYPWKRHHKNRNTYDPELRNACTPTKDDVFKLLVHLHENRNGRNGNTINFCNRKRPARAIFTNIRFLG
uniref:Uncharacterized protein n=1 Tax=Glossina brevipalpis TaxID=37001 RepID=A0A1A9W1U3_9MUSC